ncbi:hypothetical protein DAEQUDRAFT_723486 [Daedalea quercina L-15889]|uniref:Uncharacterized protein n=1 Tax=Daedalea quercina L-15889 TaxID=1314783 RepID=A0A165SEN1_9APHY|nr:hypothetical protein DAEQUDRAFT_723486 [Daedalea quercina L-15889]
MEKGLHPSQGFDAGSTLSTCHVEKSVYDNSRHVATAHDRSALAICPTQKNSALQPRVHGS